MSEAIRDVRSVALMSEAIRDVRSVALMNEAIRDAIRDVRSVALREKIQMQLGATHLVAPSAVLIHQRCT